jgi:hypothetical protein
VACLIAKENFMKRPVDSASPFFGSSTLTARKGMGLVFFLSFLWPHLSAQAADVNLTDNGLQTDVNDAGTSGTVIFPAGDGTNFSNSTSAVTISHPDLTLQGGQSSNFSLGIKDLADSIAKDAQSKPDGLSGIAESQTQRFIGATGSTLSTMSFIKSDGGNRNPGGTDPHKNNYKWLSMGVTSGQPYSSLANGFGWSDLYFTGARVSYSDTYIVNGLIGNINTADGATGFGNITGNAFTNLGVSLDGGLATQYLAGGGIIGVRSTGNSAYAGTIDGNLFSGLSVTTWDNGSDTSNKDKGSPYLEGGGVIGINAASSPGINDGQARLDLLANNLFTGIKISSGDVILGGGVVGLNNNSKKETGNTFNPGTILGTARNNIFGNGTLGDISVISGFSLRGGGVIGLNGLSSAGVQLGTLQSNVFNGVEVAIGSYIKGGGLVGLHTNDGGDGKCASPELGDCTPSAAPAVLSSAASNLFLNANVSAATYLYGGGIIGLRSNMGAATLGDLENSIFQGLTVSAKGVDANSNSLMGGGIVGVSSEMQANVAKVDNNSFDDLTVSAAGHLKGGGIIGTETNHVSPLSASVMGDVTRNTFTSINVTATTNNGTLQGGGVVGLRANEGAATLGSFDSNVFQSIEVSANGKDVEGSSLMGGGIVGVSSEMQGNMTGILRNQFSDLKVSTAGHLMGGGVIGTETNDTSSSPDSPASVVGQVTQNSFSRIEVATGSETSPAALQGGGIIGLRANMGAATLGNLENSTFQDLTVSAKGRDGSGNSLMGGGIVGVSSEMRASVAKVDNNSFDGLTVSATGHLKGGGIVGTETNDTSSSESPASVMGEVTRNTFTTLNVTTSNGTLQGGGVIGLRANEGAATLGRLEGNVFGGGAPALFTVSAGGVDDKGNSLMGGGIVGVSSEKQANVTSVVGNDFNSLTVSTAGHLMGGGIIGTETNDDASSSASVVSSVTKNTFRNLDVGIGNGAGGGVIQGGGVIGLRASMGAATLGSVENNVFQDLTVRANGKDDDGDSLMGGGIVGVSSEKLGQIASVVDNVFHSLTVSTTGHLKGGGIIGAKANDDAASAVLGDVVNNTFGDAGMSTLHVQTGGAIQGGGIIGVQNESGQIGIGNLNNNRFYNPNVASGSYLSGGGIVGVRVGNGDAAIKTLDGNHFYNSVINVAEHIEGGGVVGVRSNTVGAIGTISDTWFAGSQVTVGTYIDGGGIVGVTGSADGAPRSGIGSIVDSVFAYNNVSAKDGQIMGGLVYSYGLAGGLTITDSVFLDNVFSSNVTSAYGGTAGSQVAPRVYGAVTVDTGAAARPEDGGTHTLTLRATSSGSTAFMDNVIQEGTGMSARAYTNSLYFGTILDLRGLKEDGTLTAGTDAAKADAALVVDTEPGGTVLLYDPVRVNQDNGHTFNMTVQGGGDLLWSGNNQFTVDAPGTVGLRSGSKTTFLTGFSLDAFNHTFNLDSGARLNVMGENRMSLDQANLNGTLFFNLYATTKNQADTALLTLETTAAQANIEGSTVLLNNFKAGPLLQAGDRFYLISTDGTGRLAGDPQNNYAYARQGYTIGYNFIIDKKPEDGSSDQYLVARLVAPEVPDTPLVPPSPQVVVPDPDPVPPSPPDPSVLPEPPAVIDPPPVDPPPVVVPPVVPPPVDPSPVVDPPVDVPPVVVPPVVPTPPVVPDTPPPPVVPTPPVVPDTPTPAVVPTPSVVPDTPSIIPDTPPAVITPTPPVNPQYYVPVGPAPETTVLTGGRAASLAFLASWLPDHSYQSADLALNEDRGERAWVPFGGVDTAHLRIDAGSRISLTSSSILLGFATRNRSESGVSLLGIFLEGRHGDFDTRNHLAGLPRIDGDGKLRAFGGGLMGRHTWNNDFRIEASLRAGHLRNEFRTKRYENEDGVPARYKVRGPYLAAHLGVGKSWQISEKNNLDVLARYYWTRQNGDRATLPNGEQVRFYDDESQRARIGTRLTHTWKENRFWYVGVAVERELDSKVRASGAHGFAFETHDFKGTTSIGEIGLIVRSRENSPFSIEAGLQGYAGKFKGFSGGVRLGWEF